MATNVCTIGGGIRIKATFSVLSVNTDPTTIEFKIKNPSGVTTTYTYGVDAEVVREVAGIYYLDLTISAEGEWWYKVIGTGAVIAAHEGVCVGKQSQFS